MSNTAPHLSPSDVARRIGTTPATVCAYIRAGSLDAVVLPTGRYRIAPAAVDAMLRPAAEGGSRVRLLSIATGPRTR